MQRPVQLVEQGGTVGETGERIVGGPVGQLLLEHIPLGDLAPGDADRIAHLRRAELEAPAPHSADGVFEHHLVDRQWIAVRQGLGEQGHQLHTRSCRARCCDTVFPISSS